MQNPKSNQSYFFTSAHRLHFFTFGWLLQYQEGKRPKHARKRRERKYMVNTQWILKKKETANTLKHIKQLYPVRLIHPSNCSSVCGKLPTLGYLAHGLLSPKWQVNTLFSLSFFKNLLQFCDLAFLLPALMELDMAFHRCFYSSALIKGLGWGDWGPTENLCLKASGGSQ